MYVWLENTLRTEYEPICLLKESPRGSVRLIRHRGSGRRFILRRFTGNGESTKSCWPAPARTSPW